MSALQADHGGTMARRSLLTLAIVSLTLGAALQAQRAAAHVDVAFDDWTVPTPNSHPHDPAWGPGDMLWYTGQLSNKVGRVEMATGMFREYTLPGRHGPHGIVADRDGNIWYTANTAGAIAKLDPKTGQVAEFKMPDPAAYDPHTPIFAP